MRRARLHFDVGMSTWLEVELRHVNGVSLRDELYRILLLLMVLIRPVCVFESLCMWNYPGMDDIGYIEAKRFLAFSCGRCSNGV